MIYLYALAQRGDKVVKKRERPRLRGWLWMLRKFGPRRTWRYWRAGRRRGWMTNEHAELVMAWGYHERRKEDLAVAREWGPTIRDGLNDD